VHTRDIAAIAKQVNEILKRSPRAETPRLTKIQGHIHGPGGMINVIVDEYMSDGRITGSISLQKGVTSPQFWLKLSSSFNKSTVEILMKDTGNKRLVWKSFIQSGFLDVDKIAFCHSDINSLVFSHR